MTYLLDTNVISELVARQPNERVVVWLRDIPPTEVYLSALTIGEIKRGIEKLPADSRRRHELAVWLEEELLVRFQGRIVALDAAVMLEWGRLVAGLEGQGRRLPLMDSLIAVQAIYHRHELVTRNVKDFAGTGARLLNPWE